MFRIPDRRIEDPLQQPHAWRERRAGFRDQRDLAGAILGVERYTDRAILQASPIAWQAPVAGADQAVTSTSFVPITGSDVRVSLGNLNGGSWLVAILDYRVVIQATDAADLDVWATVLVDWRDDGTWVLPDLDRETDHGIAGAYATSDYAESAGTGVAFPLHAAAVLRVRGGGTVGIAAGVRVASGTATVNLTGATRTPQCVGFAIPTFGL